MVSKESLLSVMSIIGRLKFLKQTLTALSVTAPKEPLLLVLSINHQLRISDRMHWQKGLEWLWRSHLQPIVCLGFSITPFYSYFLSSLSLFLSRKSGQALYVHDIGMYFNVPFRFRIIQQYWTIFSLALTLQECAHVLPHDKNKCCSKNWKLCTCRCHLN